jgi:hypothetical protein
LRERAVDADGEEEEEEGEEGREERAREAEPRRIFVMGM